MANGGTGWRHRRRTPTQLSCCVLHVFFATYGLIWSRRLLICISNRTVGSAFILFRFTLVDGTTRFLGVATSRWLSSMFTSAGARCSQYAQSSSRVLSQCIIVELHRWDLWAMVQRSGIRAQSTSSVTASWSDMWFSRLVMGYLFS